jgi:hypothetical protein
MLVDLEKNTVDFGDNYAATKQEPLVLPARIPNLMVNGSSGIAVGMTTNIPPHNLGEVCDAEIYLIEHPDATTEDLMKIVRGPDFPTTPSKRRRTVASGSSSPRSPTWSTRRRWSRGSRTWSASESWRGSPTSTTNQTGRACAS